MVTDKLRIWGDVGEDGKDDLVWELEDCENGTGWISIQSKESVRGIVLRLVWGARGPNDSVNGTVGGNSFLRRPYARLVKTAEVL